jgi:membrane peptidoglycan carboxypeptidase
MYDAGSISRRTYHSALRQPQLRAPAAHEAQLAAPQSVAAAFRAINPVLQGLGLPYSPQQLRQQQPFPLQVRVSLHAQLSWRLYEALDPTLATLDLRYAAIIVVDGAPVVLLGGDLDLLHYAFYAKRQAGSVSKLFFYESVWHLGYVRPDEIVPDGDLPETPRQRLGRPPYHPRNDDGQIRQRLPHHQSLSQSINKMAYLTTWGARTDAQRLAIARRLVQQFALPWQHASRRGLSHFYRTFTTDESVALGTWHATPFDVAAMLEQGFRGHTLRRDQLILAWQNTPLKHSRATTGIGLSPQLFRALRGAVAHTAPQAVLHNTPWTLTAKTGTTDGGRDAWLAGFIVPNQEVTQATIHPRITFVAWAGYDDGRPAGWYGGSVHGPVFGRFLQDWRVQAMLLALLGQAR